MKKKGAISSYDLADVKSPRPRFLKVLKRNVWRLGLVGLMVLLVAPFIASRLNGTATTAATRTLKSTESPKDSTKSNTTISSQQTTAQPSQQPSTESTSMNNSTKITINGKDMPVPADGNTQQIYNSPDGNTHINVSVSNSGSNASGTAKNGSATNSTSVNIQSDSSSSSSSSTSVDGAP
jgi:hypothetical protein